MDFKLEQFEGPLDLLLHLVKKSNVDIYNINLENIANQYLEYIKNIDNLNVASEYLVMAAELIEYKSRCLLPKYEVEEDNYEEDYKKDLIERLIEYKNYKEVTENFKKLEYLRKEIFTKSPERISNITDKKIINKDNLTIDDLIKAFNEFLLRKESEKPLNTTITSKEYFIKEVVISIRKRLIEKNEIKFFELFEEYNKQSIIVTFLAILEMSKKKEICIKQNKNFEDIYVTLGGIK